MCIHHSVNRYLLSTHVAAGKVTGDSVVNKTGPVIASTRLHSAEADMRSANNRNTIISRWLTFTKKS